MKTLTITKEEWDFLKRFILTDASDMMSMGERIEREASKRYDLDPPQQLDYDEDDDNWETAVKDDGYEADAIRAQLLKESLQKRLE